jgi:dephospho-CoA kinase
MPFPDEALSRRVEVVPHRETWRSEGAALTRQLGDLVPDALRVEHIGSTSVPGLAAKDCLDAMVVVGDLGTTVAGERLVAAGYRRRPEPWNQQETSYGVACRKQVFAPAVGGRRCNVHVRQAGGPNVRYALLFRDYLRADPEAADAWGRFKVRLAEDVDDLAAYGQIKAPAQEVLIRAAERWAREVGWEAGWEV